MRRLKTKIFFWAALLLFGVASNFGQDYSIIGHCQTSTGYVPYGALVKVYEVHDIAGGVPPDEITLTEDSKVDEYGDFIIVTNDINGSGGANLIFKLIQNVDGAFETIYMETLADTHYNVPNNSSLSFQIPSNLGVSYLPGDQTIPNNNYFLFTRVGGHETAKIDCKDSDPASQGYYMARRTGHTGTNSDMPYGSVLELFGWFGQQCNIDYYKVQYLPNGGTTWVDVNTNLPNKWYDMISSPYPINWHWVSESMGPFSVGGVDNLYRIPYKLRPNAAWSYIDRVTCFDSRLVADGLCRIKVTGYRRVGSTVVAATAPHIINDPNYGMIKLQIDNTPPTVNIIAIKLNDIAHESCDILQFGSTDTISLDFKAWDPRGHLRNYRLIAMYGHNQSVSSNPVFPNKAIDDYGSQTGTPAWAWQGNMNYSTDYPGNTYNPGMMPTCAYQFRLRASKRTTNGYGFIYDGIEDAWYITIQR